MSLKLNRRSNGFLTREQWDRDPPGSPALLHDWPEIKREWEAGYTPSEWVRDYSTKPTLEPHSQFS